jgi:hypothetical protein
MANTWRDPSFSYHTAASHDNATAFRRRMNERRRLAAAQAAEAKVKVAAIGKRKAAA